MKKRTINLIFGRTGFGKSYLAQKLIKNEKRVIVIDPMSEYESGLIFLSFQDLIDYYKEHKPETFTFICRFQSDIEIEFTFRFCKIVGNVLLVVEEAEIYISPFAKSTNFLDLVRYGRHKSVSILGIARRTSELSTDLKAQVNGIYSFNQMLPRDLKIMEELGFMGLENLPEKEYKFISY